MGGLEPRDLGLQGHPQLGHRGRRVLVVNDMKRIAVTLLLLAATLGYAQVIGLQREGARQIGGVSGTSDVSGTTSFQGLTADFTISADSTTTPGSLVYTFTSTSTDDGSIAEVLWLFNGVRDTLGTDAEVGTIVRTLDPGLYNVELVVEDDEGNFAFVTKGLRVQDIRGVLGDYNLASAIDPPDSYPDVSTRWNANFSTNEFQLNTITDYTDVGVQQMFNLVGDSLDGVHLDMSRLYTPNGEELADSLVARRADLRVQAYLNFAHAPADSGLADDPVSVANLAAGPITYYARSVGEDFKAFDGSGFRVPIFVRNGSVTDYLWNHYGSIGPEDEGNFDKKMNTLYADSIAVWVNDRPDIPLHEFFIDYLQKSPNTYNGFNQLGAPVDFNNDGVVDLEGFQWQNPVIEDGWYNVQLDFLRQLRRDYPNTRIVVNGNIIHEVQDFSAAYFDSFMTYVDGLNYENIDLDGDTVGFPSTLFRVIHASTMYDTYGKEFNQFGTTPNDGRTVANNFSCSENTRATNLLALLGVARLFLAKDCYDTFEEVTDAMEIVRSVDAGLPVSALIFDFDGTANVLRRFYENGFVEARFNPSSGSLLSDGAGGYQISWNLVATDPLAVSFSPSTQDSMEWFLDSTVTGGFTPYTFSWDIQPERDDSTGLDTFIWRDDLSPTVADPLFDSNLFGQEFVITATVTDSVGTTATATDTLTSKAEDNLTAGFTFTTSDSLTFEFTDDSSISVGEIDTYFYEAVIGGVNQVIATTGDVFSYTFPAKAGPDNFYAVTQIVSDNAAELVASSTDSVYVAVPAPANTAPTAVLATPTTSDNETFNFDATGSSDSDGTIVLYEWDWDDGTSLSGTNATPSKTFGLCGCDRTVTLTITDNDGATDTDSVTVSVAAPASGTPTVAAYSGTLAGGEVVTISGSNFGSKVPAAPLLWDTFENGTVGVSPQSQPAVVGNWDSELGSWNVSYTNARAYGGSGKAAA